MYQVGVEPLAGHSHMLSLHSSIGVPTGKYLYMKFQPEMGSLHEYVDFEIPFPGYCADASINEDAATITVKLIIFS
jgi:hypothetical protein